MDNYPPYSVLMSVYQKDNPSYLDDAIHSMVYQTVCFHDMVIVCDGPISDELDSILLKWKNMLGNRLLVHSLPQNVGLGNALAAGLPLCGCNIIARMDSDDISRPYRCELLLAKIAVGGLDLVGGAIEEFDKSPGDMGVVRKVPLAQSDILNRLKRRNPFNHVSVMYDRRVVERAGNYQSFPWMEDYWLWARMLSTDCRCANIAEVVVDVRTGDGMYSRRSNIAYLKSQIHFFSELHRLGFVNRADQLIATVERGIATFLPERFVKLAYNVLLRDRKIIQ